MTPLETVALDRERFKLTAGELKKNNFNQFRLMVKLCLAGAILEALALQIHSSYPAVSAIAGYAGAAALALVLVVRARGLRREHVQAWVLAVAAYQSLKSEVYRYRTSCGLYNGRLGGNPEDILLQRRDEILEKVKSIQKYTVEPDPKKLAPLGPLDAEGYISERVNDEISTFQEYTEHLPTVQGSWLKKEYFLATAAVLLAITLTFTHNQAYAAWVIVIILLSLASGVSAKAERYATIFVGYRAMPDRLNHILGRWRANRGTLEQLVEQIEAAVLTEAQAWVLGADEPTKETASQPHDSLPELVLHSPVSRAGA